MTREQELEQALREVMIGGNHLATHIDLNGPNHRASPHEALAYYGPGFAYDAWCCWRAIMRARAALDAPPAAEEPAARVSERGEGRGASTGLQEPVMVTRIAVPQSNLPFDPAERGFVGAVYGPAGEWKPTNPEDDGA